MIRKIGTVAHWTLIVVLVIGALGTAGAWVASYTNPQTIATNASTWLPQCLTSQSDRGLLDHTKRRLNLIEGRLFLRYALLGSKEWTIPTAKITVSGFKMEIVTVATRVLPWCVRSLAEFEQLQLQAGRDVVSLVLRIPLGATFLLLATYPIIAFVYGPLCRGRRRRREGLCSKCAYDLRASADRCPECGTVARTTPRLSQKGRILRWTALVIGALLVLTIILPQWWQMEWDVGSMERDVGSYAGTIDRSWPRSPAPPKASLDDLPSLSSVRTVSMVYRGEDYVVARDPIIKILIRTVRTGEIPPHLKGMILAWFEASTPDGAFGFRVFKSPKMLHYRPIAVSEKQSNAKYRKPRRMRRLIISDADHAEILELVKTTAATKTGRPLWRLDMDSPPEDE